MNAFVLPERLTHATVTAIQLTPLQLGKVALNADQKYVPTVEDIGPVVSLARIREDGVDNGAHACIHGCPNHPPPSLHRS
jgi:hypothetical protein